MSAAHSSRDAARRTSDSRRSARASSSRKSSSSERSGEEVASVSALARGSELGAELAILLRRGVQVLVLALEGGSEADHLALEAALRAGRVSGTRQGLGRTLGGISGRTRGGWMGRGSREGEGGRVSGAVSALGTHQSTRHGGEDIVAAAASAVFVLRGVPEGDGAGSAPAS